MPASTILVRTTCPHCWENFATEDIVWVSAHADLLGDQRLGPEQQQRFLPTRFNVEGNALDAKGFVCHTLACPKCHLPVPRVLLENEPLFVSILGTPACGKSYFLTAMSWELRQRLPKQFHISFADADTVSNRSLNEYEEYLFLNPRADELLPLADLIRKTELQGDLYDTVMFGNQAISYPRPFLFSLHPRAEHLKAASGQRLARVLCLYDNAGEHFQPGQDSTSNPVTQHLTRSRLLFFLFDPTQDQRFRKRCFAGKNVDSAVGRTSRQESVLREAAGRVRRYTGLAQNARHTRPLYVVVTKLDTWAHLLDDRDFQEPWVHSAGTPGLDLDRIEKRSRDIRQLMLDVCPEVVTAAEDFAHQVVYFPVSALGTNPSVRPPANQLMMRPRDIRPVGVMVPLLYGLAKSLPGLMAGFRRKPASEPVINLK